MSELTNFSFGTNQVRVILINNEPWFLSQDVCDVLECDRTVVRRLKEYEKGVHSLHTPGGNQDMTIISESGLYRLVLTSRKPQAEPFQDWVCQEVLPQIRKNGHYQQKPMSEIELIIQSAQQLLAVRQEQERIKLEQQIQAEKLAELEAIAHQHDAEIDRIFNPNAHYYSVIGYCSKFLKKPISTQKAAQIGKRCSHYCREHKIDIQPLSDPRYGNVNSYPEHVIKLFV